MADDLNMAIHYPYSLRAVIIGALGIPLTTLLLLLSLPVSAEMLPDPTRPSVGYDALQGNGTEQDGPVLQSVMISPGHKSVIISGVKVDLGGKYANAKLISVNEGEAVLQRGGVLQTLKLFPGVEKRTPRVTKIIVRPAATNPVQKSGKKTYDK